MKGRKALLAQCALSCRTVGECAWNSIMGEDPQFGFLLILFSMTRLLLRVYTRSVTWTGPRTTNRCYPQGLTPRRVSPVSTAANRSAQRLSFREVGRRMQMRKKFLQFVCSLSSALEAVAPPEASVPQGRGFEPLCVDDNQSATKYAAGVTPSAPAGQGTATDDPSLMPTDTPMEDGPAVASAVPSEPTQGDDASLLIQQPPNPKSSVVHPDDVAIQGEPTESPTWLVTPQPRAASSTTNPPSQTPLLSIPGDPPGRHPKRLREEHTTEERTTEVGIHRCPHCCAFVHPCRLRTRTMRLPRVITHGTESHHGS